MMGRAAPVAGEVGCFHARRHCCGRGKRTHVQTISVSQNFQPNVGQFSFQLHGCRLYSLELAPFSGGGGGEPKAGADCLRETSPARTVRASVPIMARRSCFARPACFPPMFKVQSHLCCCCNQFLLALLPGQRNGYPTSALAVNTVNPTKYAALAHTVLVCEAAPGAGTSENPRKAAPAPTTSKPSVAPRGCMKMSLGSFLWPSGPVISSRSCNAPNRSERKGVS